jgi:hypothetical protein
VCQTVYKIKGAVMRENPAMLEMKKKPLQKSQWLEDQF